MANATTARPRNASATRAGILSSARRAFARSGYDGVGVREIAEGAGVTAMLINRYFGSKAGLFAEVVADTMAEPIILTGDTLAAPDLAARIATALVEMTQPGSATLDGFQIMFHSASSPQAAEIGRAEIERHHQKTLTDVLGGNRAAERAALILSLVAGVQVMRQTIGLPALTDADPKALAALLTRMLEPVVGGP